MSNEILSGGYFFPLVGDKDVYEIPLRLLYTSSKRLYRWRRFRRAAHEGFSPRAVEKYQGILSEAASLAMLRTILQPQNWEHNLEAYVPSQVLGDPSHLI